MKGRERWERSLKALSSHGNNWLRRKRPPENAIKLLILAANPSNETRLAIDREVREIKHKIRAARHRDAIQVVTESAVRLSDLLRALNEHQPHIVHFSGHGVPDEAILLLDDDGRATPINSRTIVGVFEALRDNIRIVVFNACFSEVQAQAVIEHVGCAVGMRTDINDTAAAIFSASFYQAIGFGRSVGNAFAQALVALQASRPLDAPKPVLLSHRDVDPDSIYLLPPVDNTAEATDTISPEGEQDTRVPADANQPVGDVGPHLLRVPGACIRDDALEIPISPPFADNAAPELSSAPLADGSGPASFGHLPDVTGMMSSLRKLPNNFNNIVGLGAGLLERITAPHRLRSTETAHADIIQLLDAQLSAIGQGALYGYERTFHPQAWRFGTVPMGPLAVLSRHIAKVNSHCVWAVQRLTSPTKNASTVVTAAELTWFQQLVTDGHTWRVLMSYWSTSPLPFNR